MRFVGATDIIRYFLDGLYKKIGTDTIIVRESVIQKAGKEARLRAGIEQRQ